MPYGPCNYCGATNYGMSTDGPFVCPACACGPPSPRAVRLLREENMQLRAGASFPSALPPPLFQPIPHGCICPPGSELTCKGEQCPRRAPKETSMADLTAEANGKPYTVEERLSTQIIGRCTCDTKTNDPHFHAVDCTYAAAMWALEVIRLKDERIDSLTAEVERLRESVSPSAAQYDAKEST